MIQPICPSCGVHLDKVPQRKTKCKACGEFIFIKDTPRDRTKKLLTAAQAEAADLAWAEHHDEAMRKETTARYGVLLDHRSKELAKFRSQGFRSVQVFGANDKTCPVCRSMMGRVLPATTPAKDILRPDCERFRSGVYHCAPCVSPVIKDGAGSIRFDR